MIRFFNNDVKIVLNNKLILKKWIKYIVSINDKELGDINIVFCSDDKLLEINRQFLKHNYYTDIITFNNGDEELIEGELYISLDTVRANSVEYKVDFYNELERVIIHGILHLIGFDDKSANQKKIMRSQENIALEILQKRDFINLHS